MTPKYKLVPVEPTEEMINAVNWRSMGDVRGRKYAPQTYRAMIEAAPSPPHDPYKALEVAREALKEQRTQMGYPDLPLAFSMTITRMLDKALSQIDQVLGDKEGK